MVNGRLVPDCKFGLFCMKKVLAVFALGLVPTFAIAAAIARRRSCGRGPASISGPFGAGFGSSPFSDPAGPPIFGGTVRGSAALGGGQIGYNWQVPNTALVLGVEADADAISADGSGTCFASSGFFISANFRVHPDAGRSFTGRAGFATGPAGRTLLYVRGGVAWLDERIEIITNNPFSPTSTALDGVRWGWTAGAGVERALTPAWLLRLEYDYAKFGDVGWRRPQAFFRPFRRRSSALFRPPPARPMSARACKP
jgi:opacity protein-like surface antigen